MSDPSLNTLSQELMSFSANKSLENIVSRSKSLLNSLKRAESLMNQESTLSMADADPFKSLKKDIKEWKIHTLKNEKSANNSIKRFRKTVDKTFTLKFDTLLNYKIPLDERNKKLLMRAIVMHLVRNGHPEMAKMIGSRNGMEIPLDLLNKFHELNEIYEAIEVKDLSKAILWATENCVRLKDIGSDLEFQVHKLRFMQLHKEGDSFQAYRYAKRKFPDFGSTHLNAIAKLLSSLSSNEPEFSDLLYKRLCSQLSKDFCYLMGLSSESPLHKAMLTSFVALPNFVKFSRISSRATKLGKKIDWSSTEELPFEVTLPQELEFHSIFICPVSKEQTTPSNPPMALPCNHLLSKQSVLKLGKSGSFKCPYCPSRCQISSAERVNFITI